jgi:hypothetical protein
VANIKHCRSTNALLLEWIARLIWEYKWRIVSSGMLRRVALVRTDVPEECSASIVNVTRIGELGTTSAVTSNRRKLRRNITRTKWRNIQEDDILHSHRRENLRSYKALYFKSEGCGFETRLGNWIISTYLILPAALGSRVYSVSNRNEYQRQK